MDDTTWDPERLQMVGSILSRYSAHIAPGHRIRLGMEGDPCSTYRSAEDAPRATVVDVRRETNGEVHFRAQVDGSDSMLDLDNITVTANRLWEIDPDYIEEFRGQVEKAQRASSMVSLHETNEQHYNNYKAVDDHQHDGVKEETIVQSEYNQHTPRGGNDDIQYRSSVDKHFNNVEQQMHDNEEVNRTFRETMASTVRALAGDLLRTSQGVPIEFAHAYADRYDLAVAERMSDGFRGDSQRTPRHQHEKTNFTPYPPEQMSPVRTSSELSN